MMSSATSQPPSLALERSQWLARLPALAFALAVAGAATLVFRLALSRHIHVDEFHNVFSMQLVGSFGHSDYADPAELYHVLFAPFTRHFTTTRSMFFALRIVWAAAFVGLLAAVAWVQPFFPQRWGRTLVFLGVASWWPAWRHGFEIRHDLLLAFGVVALYRVALAAERPERLSPRNAALAGAVAAWMQLDSHKALTLWAPALLFIVLLRARRSRADAVHSGSWLALGLALGLLAGFGVLFCGGALRAYFAQLVHFTHYAAGAERFSALPLFELMLNTGSVSSFFALLFFLLTVVQALRGRLPAHAATTLAFLFFTLPAAAVNPVPYPYNLVWMTPAILFAAVAGAHWFVERARWCRAPLAGALLVVLSIAQFATQLERDGYLHRSWDAQLLLIDAAESLTGLTDPIFDGVGMVCTRPPATRDWLLHSVFMPEYRSRQREQVRDLIARVAPPLLIGGHYRFNWLSDADRVAIAAHYLGVSNQLWVLGAQTDGGEQQIQILRTGRYQVRAHEPASGALQIDAQPRSPGEIVWLPAGPHHVSGAASIVWLGPSASELPTGLLLGESLLAPAQLPGQ
jgi:hypothetical protein